MKVAQMPWDKPPQAPAPPMMSNPTKPEDGQVRNGDASRSVQVKSEIIYEDSKPQPAQFKLEGQAYENYAAGGTQLAQQRAAQNMYDRYGPSANASIQASGLPQQHPGRSLNLPGGQRPQAPQQHPNQYSNGLSHTQTDGANDDMGAAAQWKAIVARSRVSSKEREDADGLLRRMVEEQLGLYEVEASTKLKRSKPSKVGVGKDRVLASTVHQFDGIDEDDEDAINSDLDDPEDELEGGDDEEEGPLGEMILCTWDKVNRVKNKVCILMEIFSSISKLIELSGNALSRMASLQQAERSTSSTRRPVNSNGS